jgi:hypothetical protein
MKMHEIDLTGLETQAHTDEDKLCGRNLRGKPRKASIQSCVARYLEQIRQHVLYSRFKSPGWAHWLVQPFFQLYR